MEYLAKGKRGVVYVDREKNIVVKEKNPKSDAIGRLAIEAKFLEVLNKHNIGPKYISFKDEKLTREFIDGERILVYLETATSEQTKHVLHKTLEQCRTMDKLGINKQEMTNPYKHILIAQGEPIMIDFERCAYTEKPKNVTQFIQFLLSAKVKPLLESKGITLPKEKLFALAATYKKERSEDHYTNILKIIFP